MKLQEVSITSVYLAIVTVQKARDPIASENRIFIWNTPKYSGWEEINGRAGADLSAVQVQISSAVQVQWARQSRVSSPGREYSPDPSGNLQKRDQARTASGPGRLTQRINEPPAKQRSDNASQKRQPDIGSADELHL